MKINYLRNFDEDQRISMNEYADDLIHYQKNYSSKFEVTEHKPKIHPFFKLMPDNWKLRFARYIGYPLSIKKLPNYDITHVLDHSYAHLVKNIKSKVKILTVHDLIPLIYEGKPLKDIYNFYGKKSDKNKKYLFRYSTKHFKYFDRIIAVSHNTKKDILKLTDCLESKITVIHMNIPKEYFNLDSIDKEKICQKYKIPIKPKKILISGNGFYKNHITSIKILENLLDKNFDVCIVWIGHKGDVNKINNHNIVNKIYKIPIVDKKELPFIYKICDVALVPSLYEGMGLVAIEAMRTGIPVVTSNTSSIPEIVGEEGITCDPTNDEQMTQSIIKLLINKEFYRKKINDGLIRSKLFDYDRMHKSIISIYKDELSKKVK